MSAEVSPWVAVAAFGAVGLLVCLLMLLALGLIIGALVRLRCPRCLAQLVWGGTGQNRRSGKWYTAGICLKCRRLLRLRKSELGWTEAGTAE